ncbi:MAG: phosphotransferase family protein [Gammaproteobacteria bacterium]|nr:phosphotransferase family protein [Gammaproteobacteria bacterium]
MSAPTNDIDIAALGAYLEQQIDSFHGLRELIKFDVGQSNPTYKLVADSGEYVLRRQPPGELLKSAHQVDREYRVMHALADTDVPVPPMYHLCEDRDVLGSMFFVMGFAAGEQFIDPRLPPIDKADRKDYFYAAIDTMAAIHDVDLGAVGLSDFGRGVDYFARQTALWTKQYRAAETDNKPDMETLIEWLPANMPADDGQLTLTHGDYKFDNMLFVRGQPQVLAVLDWELSTLGHPVADLAYFCMCLRMPSSGLVLGLGGLDLKELGIPGEEQLLARYCSTRSIDDVPYFNTFLAFSFFRLASISQGVYKRSKLGNASSEKAVFAGEAARLLAAEAVKLIN